jgi:FkbM family methyltransferase
VNTIKVVRSTVNYRLGRAANWLGYGILRSDRIPQGNLNLLEAGFAMLLLAAHRQIRIIQVGAFDGMYSDPLIRVLRDRRVEAILVEPQPEPFHILERTFAHDPRVRLENAAISDRSGQGLLYVPTSVGPSPLASLIPSHRFRFGGSEHREIPIQMITIQDLLTKHGWTTIDMLQVDAEGYDLTILQMVFAMGLEPAIVNLESHHLPREERDKLRQLFADRDYNFLDWGIDTLAVRRPLIDLIFG